MSGVVLMLSGCQALHGCERKHHCTRYHRSEFVKIVEENFWELLA